MQLHAQGSGRLPTEGAHQAPRGRHEGLQDEAPFHRGRDSQGVPRRSEGQRPQRVLPAANLLQLLRGDGHQPVEEQGFRRDSRVGVGRVPGRRGDGEGDPVHRLELVEDRPEDAPAPRKVLRELRQLRARSAFGRTVVFEAMRRGGR